MKILVYRPGGPPLEVESDRVAILCGRDHYEVRELVDTITKQSNLLVQLEKHGGSLAMDLAVFPNGGNSVRLKGGLR